MKGYTDFFAGFLGAEAIATKPIGDMKYMDWERAARIVSEHPDSTIYAGLLEDWNNTSGLIFDRGEYQYEYVYGCSCWATPILDVDGEEIECYVTEKPAGFTSELPEWWGEKKNTLTIGTVLEGRPPVEYDPDSTVRSVLEKFSADTGIDWHRGRWSINGAIVMDPDRSFREMGWNGADIFLTQYIKGGNL